MGRKTRTDLATGSPLLIIPLFVLLLLLLLYCVYKQQSTEQLMHS